MFLISPRCACDQANIFVMYQAFFFFYVLKKSCTHKLFHKLSWIRMLLESGARGRRYSITSRLYLPGGCEMPASETALCVCMSASVCAILD